MSEDEEPRRPTQLPLARDLRALSVADLKAYAVELDAEKLRVRKEIEARGDVRSAAEAFFKKPADSA